MNTLDFEYAMKSLTPKERQITQLIVLGNSSEKIAALLKNSKRTIETHRQNIAVKFDTCGQGKLYLFIIKNKSRIKDYLIQLECMSMEHTIA